MDQLEHVGTAIVQVLGTQLLDAGITVIPDPATATVRIEGIETYWGSWGQPTAVQKIGHRLNAIYALLTLIGYGILPVHGCPPYLVILRSPDPLMPGGSGTAPA